MISRRGFLFSGGAVAMVVGLGAVGYARGPGMAAATRPWRQAGEQFGDVRLDALAYAILAPNPHNRQPWWFQLVGDDTISVRIDLDKRLPETDPFDRQITIGFGCMLELLRQAGAQQGYRVEIKTFPDGEPFPRLDDRPVATVRFVEDAGALPDPLFAEVLSRRSTKEPFDLSRPVSGTVLTDAIASARPVLPAASTVDAGKIDTLRTLTWDAFAVEYETAHTRRESIDLMRIGNRAVTRNPDGIDLGGTTMGLMQMAGMITPEALDTPGTTAYDTGLNMYRDMTGTAQGYVWLMAPHNTRASQLQAGFDWVRLNLALQAEGVSLHPLSQALQEYPEMADLFERTRTVLGAQGESVVQMLGRVGYGPQIPPSPRWPLQAKLVETSV